MALTLTSNFLLVVLDHVSSSPSGTTNGLEMTLATWLPNDCKKMVILIFKSFKREWGLNVIGQECV